MAELFVCDRCGAQIREGGGMKLENFWAVCGGKYYLCRACAKDFKAFMKNKGGEENAR